MGGGGVAGSEEGGGERLLPNPTEATNVEVENRCWGFGGGMRDCARLALRFSICWLTLFPMLAVLSLGSSMVFIDESRSEGWSQ